LPRNFCINLINVVLPFAPSAVPSKNTSVFIGYSLMRQYPISSRIASTLSGLMSLRNWRILGHTCLTLLAYLLFFSVFHSQG